MKRPKAPKLVTVSIFTTVTLIFWVFFGLYNILVSQPEVDVEKEILDTLDPTLNIEVLDKLPSKIFINESDINFKAENPDTFEVTAESETGLLNSPEETVTENPEIVETIPTEGV